MREPKKVTLLTANGVIAHALANEPAYTAFGEPPLPIDAARIILGALTDAGFTVLPPGFERVEVSCEDEPGECAHDAPHRCTAYYGPWEPVES